MTLTERVLKLAEFDFLYEKMCKEETGPAVAREHEYGARWAHNYVFPILKALLESNEKLVEVLKDAEYIFAGSRAIEGQSDKELDKHEEAIMRLLEAQDAHAEAMEELLK